MQFKTLAVVAIAAAAVSAQTFENNPCSQCVLSSFKEDTSCKSLSAEDMGKISAALQPTKVDPLLLAAAVQKPEIRACVCHWATTGFVAGGAASSCTAGATAVCNATQQGEAADGIKRLTPILGCNGTPSGSTPQPSGGAGSPSPSPSAPAGGKSSASSNIPNVILAAVVGLAAFVGF